MKILILILTSILVNLYVLSQAIENNGNVTDRVKKERGFINLLTAQGFAGLNSNGLGLNYTGFNYKPTGRFFAGFSLGFESANFKATDEKLKIRMNTGQLGLRLMGKISKQFYVNIGIMALIGKEKVERTIPIQTGPIFPVTKPFNQQEENTVLGFAPSQGIFFVPSEKMGFTVGLSIYQRLFNSDYYRYDIGGMLSIGLKF